jgi:hypothetical protein
MRRATFDPTAGERARHIQENPRVSPPIVDPTDPRWGKLSPDDHAQVREATPVADPTDPEYGQPSS